MSGFRNTSSQIAASYAPEGRYVVAASEDSHVYIWKREPGANSRAGAGGASPLLSPASSGGKTKRRATTHSHEHFYCKDVSVALPWPGPTATLPTSVSNNGSVSSPSPETPICDDASCSLIGAQLPPLPPNKKSNVDTGADTNSKKDSGADTNSKKDSGADTNSKKDSGADIGSDSFRDPGNRSTSESVRSESFGSVLSSPLTSVLASPLNSALFTPISDFGGSWRKNTSNRFGANQDSAREGAWGLVVVTASMAGDIRVYQNFGLPVRLNRSIQLV